jgi:hypothetical protein
MTAMKMMLISAMVSLTAWGCASAPNPEGYESAYVPHGKTTQREVIWHGNPAPAPVPEAKTEPENPPLRGDTFSYVTEGKAVRRVAQHNVLLAPTEIAKTTVLSDRDNPEPGSYYTIILRGKQPCRVLVHDVKEPQDANALKP